MAADDGDGGAELLLPRGVVQVLRRVLLLGEEDNDQTVVPIVQSCVAAPSAQHQVWIVHLHDAAVAVFFLRQSSANDDLWRECLVRGHNRVVVRVWRGRCRWWNLHYPHNDDRHNGPHNNAAVAKSSLSTIRGAVVAAGATTEKNEEENDDDDNIARHELWGYRTAQLAFDNDSSSNDRDGSAVAATSTTRIRIPAILYDGRRTTTTTRRTGGGDGDNTDDFAIFEYVGAESTLFVSNQNPNNNDDDDSSCYSMDSSWTDGMVKMRDEFGFVNEPHPRWGRVPVHLALSYAIQILQEIVLPLHAYCRRHRRHGSSIGTTAIVVPHHYYTFHDLVTRHRRLLDTVIVPTFLAPKEAAPTSAYGGGGDDDANGDTIGATTTTTTTRPVWAAAVVRRLQAAIIMEETMIEPSPLAPVLVHMDLQPQNIIFGHRRCRRPSQPERKDNPPGRQQEDDDKNRRVVLSVLDWEEAAWADPRFELLLLGRKVCANRSQALAVWEMYQTATGLALGSLNVWLRLETIHSLITFLLQAATGESRGGIMETTTPPDNDDLWDKIQREMARLDAYDDYAK
jgi:hypothetical protein